jgi:hypothetical protein
MFIIFMLNDVIPSPHCHYSKLPIFMSKGITTFELDQFKPFTFTFDLLTPIKSRVSAEKSEERINSLRQTADARNAQ